MDEIVQKAIDSQTLTQDQFVQKKTNLETKGYSILSNEDAKQDLEEVIQKNCELFNLSRSEIIVYLLFYHWKIDKFHDDYLTCDDIQKTVGFKPEKLNHFTGVVTCPVCFDEFDPKDIFSLRCGHYLCQSCWSQYIKANANTGSDLLLRCFYRENNKENEKTLDMCSEPLFMDFIEQMVGSEYYMKICDWLLDDYVYNNKTLFRFQNIHKDCSCLLKRKAWYKGKCICRCGYAYCSRCFGEYHYPATCAQYKSWMTHGREERETYLYIYKNVKPCPKCKIPIYKNVGCNHMICRKCKYQFCWMCMEEWSSHRSDELKGYYTCKKYQTSNDDITTGIENNFNSNHGNFIYSKIKEQENNLEMTSKMTNNITDKNSKGEINEEKDPLLKELSNYLNDLNDYFDFLRWSYVLLYLQPLTISQDNSTGNKSSAPSPLAGSLSLFEEHISTFNKYIIEFNVYINEGINLLESDEMYDFKQYMYVISSLTHYKYICEQCKTDLIQEINDKHY
ncbi:hypothetical protein WA158_007132 [Blastocystis sp. Blastoise]